MSGMRGSSLAAMALAIAATAQSAGAATMPLQAPRRVDIPKSALGDGSRGSGGNKYYESRAKKARRRKLGLVSKRINRRREK